MKRFSLNKIEDGALDPGVTARVRRMYSPPSTLSGDTSYWSSLEQRIMARVNDPAFVSALEPQVWWGVLEGWSRAGLVAAGIAVAVSAALFQGQATDDNSAVYEFVSATPAPEAFSYSVDIATQHEASVQDDAVLNYVLAR